MKKFIIPIGLSVLFIIIFKQVNPDLDTVGALLAILLGTGIGAGINSLIFKVKKQQQ